MLKGQISSLGVKNVPLIEKWLAKNDDEWMVNVIGINGVVKTGWGKRGGKNGVVKTGL